MKSLQIERYYPYGIALLVITVWAWVFSSPTPNSTAPILGASVTVSAVLGGFLGASKTIVLSLRSTRLYQRLQTSGYLEDLFRYMTEAIVSALVLLSVSLSGFFLNMSHLFYSYVKIETLFFGTWMFFVVSAILNYYRIYRIMTKLLKMGDI